MPVAIEAARATGPADLEARLRYTQGTIEFGSGRFAESLAFQEEALRVSIANGDLESEALARHGLTESLFFVGPFREGLAQGLRGDELLRRLGQRPMVHHIEYMVALNHC